MIALARLLIVGFIALTVVYLCLAMYSRSERRRKLRDEWNAGSLAGKPPGEYDTFMERGMADYETSLRRKLIWGVYVIPCILIIVTLYVTNYA
jgi:hypothetical protein